ncbi:MAG: NAD(P)/FAD-dependent oxidoreductase, partial [Gammaproteobacteria bacterium]
ASRAATEDFEAARSEAARHSIWATGCRSWYLDKNGQPILWPWGLERFLEDMRAPDLSEYVLAG